MKKGTNMAIEEKQGTVGGSASGWTPTLWAVCQHKEKTEFTDSR